MYKGVTKADLLVVLKEIGEEADPNLRVSDLKDLLINSKEYAKDKDFVTDFLATTVNERKKAEDISKLNLQRSTENLTDNREETVSVSLDKLMKAVQILAVPVPKRNESWNIFFDSLERAFKHKNVPKEYKSEILLKLIGEKASNILVYVTDEELSDYDRIKSLIQKEYEPSAFSCLENFRKAKRLVGETHQQFASRLKSSWLHYCRIRNVTDFNLLVDLIISDKLFDTLDSELASHIAVRQGETWLLPEQLAKDCDVYFTAKGRSFEDTRFEKRFSYQDWNQGNVKYIPPQLRKPQYINENRYPSKSRECYICTSNSHLAKDCPNRRSKWEKNYNKNEDHTQKKPKIQGSIQKPNIKDSAVVTNVNSKHLQIRDQSEKITLYPLQKINICVPGTEIHAIIDSGTEIPILNTSLVPNLKIEPKGKILLQSAFKEKIEADLATILIHYKSPENNIYVTSSSLFALTDKLNVPCLITPDVYKTLISLPDELGADQSVNNCASEGVYINRASQSQREGVDESFDRNSFCMFKEKETSNRFQSVSNQGHQLMKKESEQVNSHVFCVAERNNQINRDEFSEYKNFLIAQKECATLQNSFKDASLGKNNYLFRDNLLFHKETICGNKIYQLVLPESFRSKVLKLAHDSIFGNHLGMRKTKERIKLSFYWPNLAKDVENYCRTCQDCQLRSPEKYTDKIPITPVVRAPYPFHTVNIDVVGEISPPSGRKHKYCLCLMDQNSKWPEVVPLRNLSAKTTCDALLEIFMRTGIPEIICSDQGTNFKSQLTREFENRLGTSPRFSTPAYPASNGLVEKFNRVFKNMLHHVIRTDPVNWDKHIPYLLFAYREVPNCTTGVSPFKLMYGREARGPLAVLKSSWSGEIPLPLNLSNSAVDYLQELKINLEKAADLATLISEKKQATYANYFNRRREIKEFQKGDLVYLLIPDSTNKLYARWTGPGEIVEKIKPHSYKVKLPNGDIRHVHVNKIRKFLVRTQTVGVIFEDDVEFGEVYPTPIKAYSQSTNVKINIDHLSEGKQLELQKLLDKHSALFSGKIQVANVGEHKIRLLTNAERKKPYIYKIPESLKTEVNKQIEELMNLGLIEQSEAEIAYPVVCVAKKRWHHAFMH